MGMNHTMTVMTSSVDMKWATPKEWFDYLDLEFDFTLDPCCQHETAKCAKHYTPQEDGLARSWADERVFMNPPYGREIGPWMRKAYHECRDNGALVVAFVPARVDTEWWHQYAAKATEVRFPKGRAKNANGQAWPFPVAVVVFRPRVSSLNNAPSVTELTAIRDALSKCGVTGDSLFARIREDIERGLIPEARSHLSFIDRINAAHHGTPDKPPAPEPDATYRCIGPGPRLEMFARPGTPLREGWGTWGNEKANDVELSTSNRALCKGVLQ